MRAPALLLTAVFAALLGVAASADAADRLRAYNTRDDHTPSTIIGRADEGRTWKADTPGFKGSVTFPGDYDALQKTVEGLMGQVTLIDVIKDAVDKVARRAHTRDLAGMFETAGNANEFVDVKLPDGMKGNLQINTAEGVEALGKELVKMGPSLGGSLLDSTKRDAAAGWTGEEDLVALDDGGGGGHGDDGALDPRLVKGVARVGATVVTKVVSALDPCKCYGCSTCWLLVFEPLQILTTLCMAICKFGASAFKPDGCVYMGFITMERMTLGLIGKKMKEVPGGRQPTLCGLKLNEYIPGVTRPTKEIDAS
ncbi:Uu.00g071480.m01.CDS01 [Anthostomella pinea]|uniref:Uu.00g071480.m01.CDS01 n=1 Tax=Anthostomella pinea TaxID=933095 RepID=A0AAI8YNR0_9PEZI|nr:Uu.00g071480.m01.CDS01 [Anthostomella pinea]